MEPGKVFNASTLASDDVSARGQGQCYSLIKSGTYAEGMTATEIHLTGNASPKGSTDCDTLIYVRSGSASLEIIGSDIDNSVQVSQGSAVHIKSGESFFWAHGNNLVALEVCIPVTGPFARKQSSPTETFQRHIKQGVSNKGTATGSREFEVLFDASKGSAAATMFIGFILFVMSMLIVNSTAPILDNLPFDRAIIPIAPLTIFILPIIDTASIYLYRLSVGRSPFSADKYHIHHLILLFTKSHLISSLVLSCLLMFTIFLYLYIVK